MKENVRPLDLDHISLTEQTFVYLHWIWGRQTLERTALEEKILVGKAFLRCVPQLKVVFGIESELNIQWIEEINEALPCSPLITVFQPLRPSAYNFASLQCQFASGFVATDDSHESCGDKRIESKAKPRTHFSLHRPVLGIRTQCNLNLSIGGVSCSPKKLCHLVNLIKIRSSPSVCINA